MASVTFTELARHASRADCWVAVRGNVYNVTGFIDKHPGGAKILLDNAGKDATKQFESLHDLNILETVAKPFLVGPLQPSSSSSSNAAASADNRRRVGNEKKAEQEVEIEEEATSLYGDLVPYADPSWYTSNVKTPYYGSSHAKVRAVVRAFVDKHVAPYVGQWDENYGIPEHVRAMAGALGVLNCVCGPALQDNRACLPPGIPNMPGLIPLEKWDQFHSFVVIDELARCASGGVVWSLIGGLGIGLPPILAFGSKDLVARVAPGCLQGKKTICLCVTEPAAGSDVANLTATATRDAETGDFILNGEKKWITNGAFADYFTVACRTEPEDKAPGMKGLSLLLVERAFKGVTTRRLACQGMWASGTAYITFENVRVPKGNLIGKPGKAFYYIMANFNHERMGMAMQALRFARVCYETALRHSLRRMAYKRPLSSLGVVRGKLAAMAARIEPAHAWIESLLHQASSMTEQERMLRLGGPTALLKQHAGQVFEFCARESAQILGGRSYTRSGQGEKIERLCRDVRAYLIPGGSEEVMLDLGIRQSLRVAKALGAKL